MTQRDDCDTDPAPAEALRRAGVRHRHLRRRGAIVADEERARIPLGYRPPGEQVLGRSKPLDRCRSGLHDPMALAGRRFCRWCGELTGS